MLAPWATNSRTPAVYRTSTDAKFLLSPHASTVEDRWNNPTCTVYSVSLALLCVRVRVVMLCRCPYCRYYCHGPARGGC